MGKTIIKTSSNNWTNLLARQCKSQKPILIINDSSLRNEDMSDIVGDLLKNFTLSSKQLILRKILILIVSVIGAISITLLTYGIWTGISSSAKLRSIIQLIFALIVGLLLTSLALYKLITAKKPGMHNSKNEIKIEWNKY